jgi:hypothetical protein
MKCRWILDDGDVLYTQSTDNADQTVNLLIHSFQILFLLLQKKNLNTGTTVHIL